MNYTPLAQPPMFLYGVPTVVSIHKTNNFGADAKISDEGFVEFPLGRRVDAKTSDQKVPQTRC